MKKLILDKKKLRKAMAEHDIFTYKELARRIGVKPRTLLQYLSTPYWWSDKIIEGVERVLGLKPQDWIKGTFKTKKEFVPKWTK